MRRIQAKFLKPGMVFGGVEVTKARAGAGSAKGWMYVTYADGQLHRDRIRGAEWIEVEG